MKEIILDSSFLIFAVKSKIDIFTELNYLFPGEKTFTVSKGVLNELKMLSSKKSKNGLYARTALKILSNRNINVNSSFKKVDEWIIDYSKEHNAVVCTNDLKLKNDLKKNKIKVITVKEKGILGDL